LSLQYIHSRSCVVSEKNSRSSSRSLGQSPKLSPGRLLTKPCPCCEDSSPAVHKRLASHLDVDDESSVTEHKRMRYSLDPGAGLAESSRSVVGEVVRRGRGRPRKVSCLVVIVQ